MRRPDRHGWRIRRRGGGGGGGWVERAARVVATVAVEVAAMVGQGVRARVEVVTAVAVVALEVVGTVSVE